jgi:ketol-acid reductoisomerase
MSKESFILLENVSVETIGYGEKSKGSGYNLRGDGLHTVVYNVDAFNGTITIQGTLELHPGANDWVDVVSIDYTSDSTQAGITTTDSNNFTGNFVWIRAKYDITDGKIVSVRYNY